MRKSTDSLGKIKIASPCDADWNEMPGDARRRHCAMCGLNVYNLSEMTRREAENFLINAEGRVCVQIRRRRDGTVITRDCPVGWQKLKRRVSRTAAAAFSLVLGVLSGIGTLGALESLRALTNYDVVPEPFFPSEKSRDRDSDNSGEAISFGGMASNLPQIKIDILKSRGDL